MSLIVRIQDPITDCQIGVVVGDAANRGTKGTLTVLIDGHVPMVKVVDLVYPPKLELFPNTPKDGKVHTVTATLVSLNDTNSDYAVIQLCNSN